MHVLCEFIASKNEGRKKNKHKANWKEKFKSLDLKILHSNQENSNQMRKTKQQNIVLHQVRGSD